LLASVHFATYETTFAPRLGDPDHILTTLVPEEILLGKVALA